MTNAVLRRAWTGRFGPTACAHVAPIDAAAPIDDVCRECEATGDTYPALRWCLTCGYVGCCDKAKNHHMLNHHQATGHPLIRPYREGAMDWVWCYVDGALLNPEAIGRA